MVSYTEMIMMLMLGVEALIKITKRRTASQLSEHYANKLRPARQRTYSAIAIMPVNHLL